MRGLSFIAVALAAFDAGRRLPLARLDDIGSGFSDSDEGHVVAVSLGHGLAPAGVVSMPEEVATDSISGH